MSEKALYCKYRWSNSSRHPMSGGVQFFVFLRTVWMFTQDNPKEDSIMEVLNIVFSALNLLATVIIGVINVTWMISRDVFRDRPRAKHYSKSKKDWPPLFPNGSVNLFDIMPVRSWPFCRQRLFLVFSIVAFPSFVKHLSTRKKWRDLFFFLRNHVILSPNSARRQEGFRDI